VLVAVGKLGCAEQLLAHGLIALKVGVYRLADLLQGEFPAPEYELIQGGERFDQGADANDIHRTVVDIQAVVPVTGLVQILHVDPPRLAEGGGKRAGQLQGVALLQGAGTLHDVAHKEGKRRLQIDHQIVHVLNLSGRDGRIQEFLVLPVPKVNPAVAHGHL